MLTRKRRVTQSINKAVPNTLQNLLWYLIESMEVESMNRVQVFELKRKWHEGKLKQHIVHSQEQPAYRKEVLIGLSRTVEGRICVIGGAGTSLIMVWEGN